MNKFNYVYLSGALATALVSGCGSSGGSSELPSAPSTPISITSNNAGTLASTSYGLAMAAEAVESNITAVATYNSIGINSVVDIALAHRDLNSTGVTSGVTESCAQGGSLEYTQSADGLTADITFNRCAENGETLDGDMHIAIDDAVYIADLEITGNNLKIVAGSEIVELLNYSFIFDWEFARGTGNYYYLSDYTINSSELGGQITVETVSSLSGSVPNPPSSGEMLFTGANNSRMWLHISGSILSIDIDSDGDNIYEQNISTTWSEIGVL